MKRYRIEKISREGEIADEIISEIMEDDDDVRYVSPFKRIWSGLTWDERSLVKHQIKQVIIHFFDEEEE